MSRPFLHGHSGPCTAIVHEVDGPDRDLRATVLCSIDCHSMRVELQGMCGLDEHDQHYLGDIRVVRAALLDDDDVEVDTCELSTHQRWALCRALEPVFRADPTLAVEPDGEVLRA